MIRVFIQARMGSSRFPGKVLAPFRGRPIIEHVVSRVASVISLDRITVATSTQESDDPLACYVRERGVSVFRGPVDDCFARFQLCLAEYPCDRFFRVCADSPLVAPELLTRMLGYAQRSDHDLVTNTFPRSFPKGLSLEMLDSGTFAGIDPGRLSPEQREHLTRFYYDNPGSFRILNLESDEPGLAATNLSVDTVEDLRRLEALSGEDEIATSIAPAGYRIAE